MKRRSISLTIICLLLLLATTLIAGELQKGTIKDIDMDKRTILFCPADTDDKITMNVGPTVKLEKFKKEMKVKIFVEEKDGEKSVNGMKQDKRKVIQGC